MTPMMMLGMRRRGGSFMMYGARSGRNQHVCHYEAFHRLIHRRRLRGMMTVMFVGLWCWGTMIMVYGVWPRRNWPRHRREAFRRPLH